MTTAFVPSHAGARLRIAPESLILATICLLDLGTTIFWVTYREAMEGNPIMAFYLHHGGTPAFIAAKMVLLTMPLLIAEWARLTNPRFVQRALRVGIAAYLTLYVLGVVHINSDEHSGNPAQAAAEAMTAASSMTDASSD